MTENFKLVYMETRCQPVEDQWPPSQPTTIVNVALIHHEGEQIQQELIDMSMRNVSAVEKLSYRHPKFTKSITDIFKSSHKCILIEGAPGIGKTVLTKEIAYRWAKDEILSGMRLFLLFIRDPDLHHVNSIKELVNYLNNDCLSDSEAEVAVEELRKSSGSGIVFVIDGYDECPCDSELKVFVDKLAQKKCLPKCMVVITSRPTASLLLRQLVDQRIEILGLAKKEQKQYISESLKGSPEMKIKLQEYLKQQPIINSLIYVPLHLAVLLYLFKQDSLPETLTEMNEYFIIHTIYRELAKHEQSFGLKVKKLSHLPPDVFDTICRLSKLAFRGLNNNQLVFTFDEVAEVCPEVGVTPVAINGYGLLQAVHHYCQKGAGKTTSLNFLHFTMQEYLAALHVTTLPNDHQSSLIKYRFWDKTLNFMWMMYVGIVGTKSISLISSLYQPEVLNSHKHNVFARKCLFIFQCYLELKQVNLMPKVVSSIFSDGNINLSRQTLLPHHITSLTVFMTRSTTQYTSLNLNDCYIGCDGMSILANHFTNFQEKVLTLKNVSLKHNNLSSLWGQLTDKRNDEITNSGLLQSVESLDLSYNQFCDSGATEMFTVWKNFQTSNEIVNVVLQDLNICGNMISDGGTVSISDYLRNNHTLKILNVSKNWISKEGVMRIVEACTKNRTLHKLVCTHNNLSKSELVAINEYTREENAVQMFDASWNTIAKRQQKWSNKYELVIKTTYQLLDTQQNLQLKSDNVQEDMWLSDEITEQKYEGEFLRNSFESFLNVQCVTFQDTLITDIKVKILFDCLMTNDKVRKLNLSNCLIIGKAIGVNKALTELNTIEKVKKLAEVIQINKTLQELNISKNNITDEGAQRLAEAIQINKTLQELNISKNWISKEGVMKIVEACTKNRTLHKLVCTHNNLSKSELVVINEYIREENAVQIFDASWNTIAKRQQKWSNKYELVIKTTYQLLDTQQNLQLKSDNVQEDMWLIDEITEQKYEGEFLRNSFESFLNVQCVTFQDTPITDIKVKILFDCLMTNDKVRKLNLSNCLIIGKAIGVNKALTELNTIEKVKKLAEVIQINKTLQELNISKNNITDEGAQRLAEAIQINKTLQELNISKNNITDEGAKRLAEAIQVNTTLQELNISKNWISKEGVMKIVEACTKNRTLHKLVCTHNNLSKSELVVINEYIREENAVQIFDASWNTISKRQQKWSNKYELVIKTTYQLLDMQQKLQSENDNVQEDMWLSDEITELKYEGEFLRNSFECFLNVQYVTLQDIPITDYKVKILSDCLKTNDKVMNLNLSSCLIITKATEIKETPRELNMSKNNITDERTKRLAEAIQVNKTLQQLNISKNNITDEGAKRLAEAIQVNITLQELNISKNWISKEGVMRIVEACTISRTLHKLVCTHNNLSKSGLADINEYIRKENAVQMFDASWNTITKKGKQYKWHNIKYQLVIKTTYQLLDIQQNLQSESDNVQEDMWLSDEITEQKYEGEFLLNSFESFFNVQYVTLQDTPITDIKVKIISDCLKTNDKVTKLNLSNCLTNEFSFGNKVTNEKVKIIAKAICVNKTLRELNMSKNNIADEGAKRLAEAIQVNVTLRELNLSHNNITDEGAKILTEAIQVNKTLQELNVSKNDFTDEGAKGLAEAIQVNKTLRKLNLSKNNVTDEGTKRLAEAIQVNTTLQELNISKNWISKEGIMRIVEACTINRTLHKLVCTYNNLSKYGLRAINEYIKEENAVQIFDASWNIIGRRLTIVSILDVQLSKAIQEKSSLIDHLTAEKRVDFLKCCLDDYDIQYLNLTHEELNVDNIRILSKCLMNNSTLKELNLSYNSRISKLETEVLADAIRVNNTLQKLNISCILSGALRFSSCLRTNSSLIELDMSKNSINCEGATAIAESLQVNTTLQKLNISHNEISSGGAMAFSDCLKTNKALKELDISHNMVKHEGAIAIAEALRKNTTLQRLYISCCETSDDAVITFCECLKNSKTLTGFGISCSTVTYEGTIAIVESLKVNTMLQKLSCKLSDNGVIVFSEYLKTNTKLIELDVSVTNIETSVHAIAETLKINNTLRKLNISQSQRFYDRGMSVFNTYHENNTVLMKGVSVIAESLTENNTLVKLNISNCKVSDDEAIVFSGYLKANSTLIELDMSQNEIMYKGATAIANALKVNSVIQTLNISHNKISSRCLETFITKENVTCEGTSALSEALKVNTTLQELNISYNHIPDDGAITFSECLKTNATLKELDISWNNITCKGARAVAEALKINNTLQKLNILNYKICYDGIKAFSECLKTNTTLIALEFATWPFASFNQYSIAIESAIKANQLIASEWIT